MEQFFANSPYALLFLGIFLIIISNRNNSNNTDKNIILIYIIYALASVFAVGDFLFNTIIILVMCFIENQILSLDNEGEITIVYSRYKIIDFIFTMLNKYKIFYIILNNLAFYYAKSVFNINIWLGFIYLFMCALVFLFLIGRVYLDKFKVKNLYKIREDFLVKSKGYREPNINTKEGLDFKEKINMLIDLEDKTYNIRKSSYTIICIESLIYKLCKDYGNTYKVTTIVNSKTVDKLSYFFRNIKKVFNLGFRILKKCFNALTHKNGIRIFIKRGYSTIEMQLMRNLAVEKGYGEYFILRKIYELIYTNIFFKSEFKRREYYSWNQSFESFKRSIIFAYYNTVPTFLNGKSCKNIFDYMKYIRNSGNPIDNKEKVLYFLSKEEVFIFILGLSSKRIDTYILSRYDYFIKKYELDKDKILKIISYINS